MEATKKAEYEHFMLRKSMSQPKSIAIVYADA